MSKMFFKVENGDEFVKMLKKKFSEENKKELNDVISEGCIDVLNKTREKCPVQTGTLRRSYRVFFEKAKSGVSTAGVMTTCQYAPYVEFGTTKRKAQPHFFISWDEVLPNLLDTLRATFKRLMS